MDTIEFHGNPGDDAEDLLSQIEIYLMSLSQNLEEEKMHKFKKSIFKRTRRGNAKTWFDKDLDPSLKTSWPTIEKAFMEYCQNLPSSIFGASSAGKAIVNLHRGRDETIAQYLKRIEDLRQRCPSSLQELLKTNMLARLATFPVDQAIKTRVEDRLYANGKMDEFQQFLSGFKYEDVRNAIVSCSASYGGIDQFEELYRNKTSPLLNRSTQKILQQISTVLSETRGLTRRPPPSQPQTYNQQELLQPPGL